MTRTKRCHYCGREIRLDAIRCAYCGGALVTKDGVTIIDHFGAVECALSEKYEIVREIGHGGNATIYEAIQKNLERKVALKVLLPGLVNDQGYLERFHLEARSIAKLRHPNIVTIYDEGKEQGIHYMAMEFLEGEDLHHIVKEKGELEVREAVAIVKGIASALDYAHDHGIIHRDVKSSNIIVTAAGTAVLTDFGIAQSGKSVQVRTGSVLGTPEFMSPEQAAGKSVDAQTDFYSLGVVLYHMLSAHYPFQGESPITTIQKILYESPTPLGKFVSLPSAIEQAINRCLEKDPAIRVQNGKELMGLLTARSAVADAPATIVAPGGGRSRRQAERRGARPRPVPDDAPAQRSVELPQSSRESPSHRPLARMMLFATVACLALTGYIAWHRVPDSLAARKIEQTVQSPMSERRLVPYLIGATKEEATKLLKREGFEVGTVSVVAVPNREQRGKVDSQHPMQGSSAKPGSSVDLLIAE